ncbi:alkyldihydroxyacetonephosphate synthase [Georgenia soli]|uniref:Alkyldihydroxyacetonephosphate synthase n=1 Tax=Georgenia soli TaxID=638953 RepID=A0A2A9F110_9MICO|nr:FAD-binding oxidoreductase [Georgenia soli]PFG45087.1 alkyldihydroxyacetonephosphate synthase [Georgenia soli]
MSNSPLATTDALAQLSSDLQDVVSADQLITATVELEPYSHDWWPLAAKKAQLDEHDHMPDIAVKVKAVDDVAAVLRYASKRGVPVTTRALGSSVTGQPLPSRGGILLDVTGLTGTPVIDAINHTVTVPAAVRGDDLEAYVREQGFTLGHSPQSLNRSSAGGWVATFATGQLSSRYGGIEDLVVGYTVVLADGRTVKLEARPRAAVGTDLRQIFIGSEGTLGVITEVVLKIFPVPETSIVEAFTLPSVRAGIDAIRTLAQSGLRPSLVRLYDETEARHATGRDDLGLPVLFLGNEGIDSVARAEHAAAIELIGDLGAKSLGAEPVEGWLGRRYDFSTVESYLNASGGYAETIEIAGRWSEIAAIYDALTGALAPLADEVLGHFSHIYNQGTSLYVILLGHTTDNRTAAERIEEIWKVAMTTTLANGGELSHHHGSGLARKPYIGLLDEGAASVARDLKRAFDPAGVLNPGKLFD